MTHYLNSTRRSVAFFKKAHDENRLEMKPPFQRNPVWTEVQKAFLIDTILYGYPIPELYVQELVNQDGVENYVIVDGQQRIRACLEFIEGAFSLAEESNWPLASFDDLTADERTNVYGYNFIVRQLPAIPDEELRAIFGRLNRNTVSLNAQELRHATYRGEFITMMEQLAEHDWWSSSGVFTANDVRRMLDIEFFAELAVACLHGPQNKKLSLEKWFRTYEEQFAERREIKEIFFAVLGELAQAMPGLAKTRWRRKSDFYSLFGLFASHAKALPLTRDGRKKIGAILIKFGAEVDKSIAEGLRTKKDVRDYARAVEKAASDLANRKTRAGILERLTKQIW